MDVPLDGTGADSDEDEAPTKKRKPFRATQRALAELRKQGCTAAIAERWNPHARIRQDLFGFVDVVALRPVTHDILALQVTTSRTAEREQKIAALDAARAWMQCGGAIEVWGYRKKCQGGVRGARKVWTLVRRVAYLDWTSPGRESGVPAVAFRDFTS